MRDLHLPSWLINAHERAGGTLKAAVSFVPKEVRTVLKWVAEPVAVFLLVLTANTAIAQPFYVPSGSMQPTLAIGDYLIAEKWPYGYGPFSIPFVSATTPDHLLFERLPRAGDVVVFHVTGKGSALVKRVVGLPGDRLQMRQGHLWINGRELPLRAAGSGPDEDGPGEPSPGTYFKVAKLIETLPNGVEHPIYKKTWNGPLDDTPEYVVPPDHVFMMGDNRDDSADSRIAPEDGGVGFVPVGNLIGRAAVVLASVDFPNARGLWEWPLKLRLHRLLNAVR